MNMHSPHKDQKVLLVDDKAINLVIASAYLTDICTVLTAQNANSALMLALQEQPDLILTGARMPDMSGFDLCQRIKSDVATSSIAVMFVTAMGDASNEQMGLDLGAIDYISKPYHPAILRARVRNHLELQRQRKLLERISQTDGLTSVANRRAFDLALDQQWLRLMQLQQPLALILLDIDAFKQFNDNCGHLAGDETLKQVAQLLQARLYRPFDMVARFGGEEFACLLPGTDLKTTGEIAEHLRQVIQDTRIEHPNSPVSPYITISVGYHSLIPQATSSANDLIQIADQYLYAAKRSGRNRCCPVLPLVEPHPPYDNNPNQS